jgi:hypothetical protein
VNYKFIVNTPREIKRVLNDKAVISSDRKTVIATYSFKELLMDSESAYLKVKM